MGETLPLWGSAKVGSSTVRNLRLARPADCKGRGYNGLQGTPLNGLPGSGLQWFGPLQGAPELRPLPPPSDTLRHGSALRQPSALRCLCRQNVSPTQVGDGRKAPPSGRLNPAARG